MLLSVFIRFCRFFGKGFLQKIPIFTISIFTERNGQLKPRKLLNLTESIGYKQNSFQYQCFHIQGAVVSQAGKVYYKKKENEITSAETW